MIEMRDAMRAVLEHRDGDVVLATETSIAAWQEVSEDDSLHLPLPVMSKGSSMALGVALARPDRRVIVWDGDGCVLMNLGTLVTIAGAAPANLYHIVLDNGMYAMTGGQPLPNQGNFSFTDMAEAAGYVAMYEFDDLEDWTLRIGDVLSEEGPVLIVMKTVPEISDMVNAPVRPRRRLPVAAPDTREALAAGE